MGNLGKFLTPDVEIAVCTIEKANILINQLIDTINSGVGQVQLTMIVVDELHLVSDTRRGFLLEVLLSKARFFWGQRIQIVGLSATLPNLDDISKWLGGILYSTEYRPVVLRTRICMERKLYDPEIGFPNNGIKNVTVPEISSVRPLHEWIMDPVSLFLPSSVPPPAIGTLIDLARYNQTLNFLRNADCEGLLSLCVETVIKDKKSVIVFCPSKKWCDQAASLVSSALSLLRELDCSITSTVLKLASVDKISPQNSGILPLIDRDLCLEKISSENIRIEECRRILFSLRQCPVAICPILEKTVANGVAYHHAGLTMDERKVVEKGFREGSIKVLCATSTLAAGVSYANEVCLLFSFI